MFSTRCCVGRPVSRMLTRNMASVSVNDTYRPGYLWTFGKGPNGQLGHGTGSKQEMRPKRVEGLTEKVTHFDCGPKHTLAVTESGRLFGWGNGDYSKLGFDAESTVCDPVHVPGLEGVRIVQAACGAYHSMALSEDGTLFTWGWGGSMFSGCGGLGHGDQESVKAPKAVKALEGVKIVAINSGAQHSAAISDKGQLFTWGKGELGRLGHGSNKDAVEPLPVEAFRTPVTVVSCGANYTAAVLDDGKLYTWGRNRAGELGQEAMNVFAQESSPWLVEELKSKSTKGVACGQQHTAAVLESGDFYIWGAAGFSWFTPHHLTPLSPPALEPHGHVIQLSAGYGFTAAVTADGAAYLWGKARKGQLGHGGKTFEREPKKLELPAGIKALRIACAQTHTALLTDKAK